MDTSFLRYKQLAGWIIVSLMLIVSTPVFAWDGFASGTVTTIQITNGNNFGFRINLNGVAAMCTGGPSWGYLNEADSNYKTYVAVLMMAKSQGSAVSVYSNLENGYCHIGHIAIG